MLCQICKKNNATIHIQEIIDGETKMLQICASCAADKSWGDSLLQGFNVAEILYNFTNDLINKNKTEKENTESDEDKVKLTCKNCNWNLKRFREKGRLGCEKCYEVFDHLLMDAIKNMHKGVNHSGKLPSQSDKTLQLNCYMANIAEMQNQLEECVKIEEYEKAAIFRDKIAVLKKKIEKSKEVGNE